jgi:hypothetical protein
MYGDEHLQILVYVLWLNIGRKSWGVSVVILSQLFKFSDREFTLAQRLLNCPLRISIDISVV